MHAIIVESSPTVCQKDINSKQSTSCDSITQFLTEMKKTIVASSSIIKKRYDRRVQLFNEEFCWDQFLSELHVVFQDALLLNYVLQGSINKVSNFI